VDGLNQNNSQKNFILGTELNVSLNRQNSLVFEFGKALGQDCRSNTFPQSSPPLKIKRGLSLFIHTGLRFLGNCKNDRGVSPCFRLR
jgi:hypothetical protein